MNHCLFCIDVYTVNEGDTLYSIAEKYDLKAKISLEWQTEEDGRVKIVRILAENRHKALHPGYGGPASAGSGAVSEDTYRKGRRHALLNCQNA